MHNQEKCVKMSVIPPQHLYNYLLANCLNDNNYYYSTNLLYHNFNLCCIDIFMFWAFVINFIILISYDYIFIIPVYTCPLIVASIRDFL